MRYTLPASAAAVAFSAATTATAAEPVNPFTFDLSKARGTIAATYESGCLLLPASDCTGKAAGLKYTSPGGFSFELIDTSDTMARTNFERNYTAAGKLHFHAHTQEYLNVETVTARVKQNFGIAENVQGQVGLYIGQARGTARANALANAKLDPFSVTIPAITYKGETYRAAQTINVPAMSHTFYEKESYDTAKSPYGGLTAGLGWGVPLGKVGAAHTALRFSGDAQAGVERVSAGLGAEILVMSSADSKAASRPGLDLLQTRGQYAVGLGVTVRKVFTDKLYAVEEHFAETRMRDRYNAHADRLNGIAASAVNDVNERLGTHLASPAIPHTTTAEVMEFLKIKDPRARLQTEVSLSGSYRLTPQATLSVLVAVPVGAQSGYGRDKPRVQASASYEF